MINGVNFFRKSLGILAISAGTVLATSAKPSNPMPMDTFEKSSVELVTKSSVNSPIAIPSPNVVIQGQKRKATIVVDLTHNKLFKYDSAGNFEKSYSIASGKKSTPTHEGVRIVSHIEKYPYRTAPASSKRRKNPGAYGAKIIILDVLNPKTGERSSTGEFIHGTNNPSSIGKFASHGCMRLGASDLEELTSQVKAGNIVLIKRF